MASKPAAAAAAAAPAGAPADAPLGGGAPALDRAAFTRTVRVPALRVPKRRCNDLMRLFKGYTLDRPKTRCIVGDGEGGPDWRLLLLREDLEGPEGLPPSLRDLMAAESLAWAPHDLEVNYSHLSMDQVLKQLLPAGVEVPSSFESVGHIAHLNLKAEVLPFKHVVGQVIMDKNPHITTVVNKVGNIESEYRVFEMEVVAGRRELEAEVVQHGMRFRLDFSKVYWNSRLETEHARLTALFDPSDAVVDVMAGIGPFAVPAGVRGCRVYANDLNPWSAAYLATNIRLNKLSGRVLPFNMDGRAFVRALLGGGQNLTGGQAASQGLTGGAAQVAEQQAEQQPEQQQTQQQQQQQQPQQQQQQPQQQQQAKQQRKRPEPPPPVPEGFEPPAGGLIFQHAVMNLPASAVEFLDSFRGAFDPGAWAGRQLPLVHVYTFMRGEGEAGVIARVEAALGGPLDAPPSIHYVRDVAPNKLMLCVTFRVPAAVAFAGREEGLQPSKRARVESPS